MKKRVFVIIMIIAVLFSLCGCNNKHTSFNPNDSAEKQEIYNQDVHNIDDNADESDATEEIIDAGKIKQETEISTGSLEIPYWDIKNDNNLIFKFKYEGQNKNYTFTAPENGVYRLSFGIDNVEQNYSVTLCKKNHEKINSFRSNSQQNVELIKEEEYFLVFSQDEGLPECNVKIYIPNPIKSVENNTVQGTIFYTGQEDTYLYNATVNGKYGFELDISNVNYSYEVHILDSKNNSVTKTNYYSSRNKDCFVNADLSKEETYTLKVMFDEKLNEDSFDYSIRIIQPNQPSTIETSTVDGEFVFYGQENIHYFTPEKSGTYSLIFYDDNEPMQYEVSFFDEKNHKQGPKNNHSWSVSFELNGGEMYEIIVSQQSDYGIYHFSIEEKPDDN